MTFTWLPFTWQSFVGAFIFFRLFDILKPWPISYIDQKVKGGLGTVLDDVAAGIVANVCLQIIFEKTSWLGVQACQQLKFSAHSETKPAQKSATENLIKLLEERAQTLSIAESCTGGLLSAQISRFPGVSQVFLGGVVSYSNHSKQNLLEVPETLIKSVGAVSTPVALRMAQGVREKFQSSWSISITGIAGPSGGTPQKPVGTVCFGISGPGIEESSTQYFSGERSDIQNSSADFAVEFLTKCLTNKK